MIRVLLVAAVLGSLCGCPATNPGILIGAMDNSEFVADERTRLLVTREISTYGRIHEIRSLRGDFIRTIGAGEFGIVDVDDAAERFVGLEYLGPRGTPRIFAGDVSGSMRPLPESGRWLFAAIDAGGTRIAVTDRERRTIKVFSFDDLRTLHELPCPANAFCNWVSWETTDTEALWFAGRGPGNNYARLDLRTELSENFAPEAFVHVRRANMLPGSLHSDRCWTSSTSLHRTNDGITLRSNDGARRLVTIGNFHHSRFDPVTFASFIAGCRYVLFGYDDRYWLADVQSGLVGRLEDGIVLVLP
jgi:hypothetical protein